MAHKCLRRPARWIVAVPSRRPSLSAPAYVGHQWVLPVGGFLPPMGVAGEKPEFDIKPPIGTPLVIFPQGHLVNSSPQGFYFRKTMGICNARQWGFEIRVFPLQDERPMVPEPHLPVCLSYRRQLCPTM